MLLRFIEPSGVESTGAQNMLTTPAVELKVKGERFSCTATQVMDGELRRHILTLRDSQPRMDRVAFAIKPSP